MTERSKTERKMIWSTEEPDGDELLAQINRKLAKESRRLNLTPDPEMGGLSPEQVARLIHLPWHADQFPMRMNDDLPLESFEQSRLFRNCRTFLTAIRDGDGVTITSGGNLTRAFVASMIDALDLNRELIDWIMKQYKTINEENIWDIHLTRVIAQSAKLIRPYKGKFRIPKKVEKLLDDRHAGKLYKQLFIGLFAKFNLAYMDGRCPCHAIQKTFPYTLYRLGTLADNKKRKIGGLPVDILLPAVLDEVEQECALSYSQATSDIVAARALMPLVELGLLSGQYAEGRYGFTILQAIKPTPLFNKFLSFPELP